MKRIISSALPVALAATVFATILLGGCASILDRSSEASGDSVIVLQPFEELSGAAGDPSTSCKVGYRYIYSPELPVSQREVYFERGRMTESGRQESAQGRSGGPLELPRPERDPRPKLREDGMMVFEVGIMTYSPCRRTGVAPLVEFTIGDCVDGSCPPMRYVRPDDAQIVTFRLAEG